MMHFQNKQLSYIQTYLFSSVCTIVHQTVCPQLIRPSAQQPAAIMSKTKPVALLLITLF